MQTPEAEMMCNLIEKAKKTSYGICWCDEDDRLTRLSLSRIYGQYSKCDLLMIPFLGKYDFTWNLNELEELGVKITKRIRYKQFQL
jgi:hypothetical protein